MAVIVQADPLDRLIRKIGYSVGLENLVDRVNSLASVYVRNGAISAGAFRDLVEKDFGRKSKTAVEHFANFYSQLNLVRATAWGHGPGPADGPKAAATPKALEPLYQLDSLSILRRFFADNDAKFEIALRVVLTQSIIEEDGDIFLNALLSDFQPDLMRVRFESMIRTKRHLLGAVMRNPGVVAKLNRIINIKNESGRSDENKDDEVLGRFGKRTQPLSSGLRRQPLAAIVDDSISIPDDYLEKVRRSRGSWAEDLGLFANGRATSRGLALISELQRGGQGGVITRVDGELTAICWGYRSDLEKLRIDPKKVGAGDWEAWDLLSAIARATFVASGGTIGAAANGDEVFDLLKDFFDLYKLGNSSKGLIRNSLPLYVAEPALIGWSVAESRAIPSLPAILNTEFQKKSRRIQRMIIRGTAGALFFSKKVAT